MPPVPKSPPAAESRSTQNKTSSTDYPDFTEEVHCRCSPGISLFPVCVICAICGSTCWQIHQEACAFPRLAGHANPAAMIVNNLRDNREPQPHASFFGGEKGIEDLLAQLGGNPRTAVLKSDLHAPFAIRTRCHRHAQPASSGAHGFV